MTDTPKGVGDHPAKEQMKDLWQQGFKAKAIVEWLEAEGLPVISQSTIARYGQRNWNEKVTVQVEETSVESLSQTIDKLQETLGFVNKVAFSTKKYQGWDKVDGVSIPAEKESTSQVIEIIPQIKLPLEPAEIAPISINILSSDLGKKPKGWSLGVHVPDMQIGYHRDADGNLTTSHDESAIDVFHQIMGDLNESCGIDLVVNAGDNLDFPEFSTHRSAPGFLQNTQLTIDRAGTEGATQRALAPDAEIIWLEGNHEYRFIKEITDKLPNLLGLSRAGHRVPVLSLSNLLRFDEYDIDYRDSYPDAHYWANDYLRFEHGSAVSGTPGGTSAKHLSAAANSSLFGHIHRQELVWSRKQTATSSRPYFAGSPGTLARIDGSLPSSRTGIKATGRQTKRKGTENWHQGIIVFLYEKEGEQRALPESVFIDNGYTIFRGKEYKATKDENGKSL